MPLSLFSPSSSPRPRPHQTQTLKSLAQLYQVTNLSLPKSTIRSRRFLQHQFRFVACGVDWWIGIGFLFPLRQLKTIPLIHSLFLSLPQLTPTQRKLVSHIYHRKESLPFSFSSGSSSGPSQSDSFFQATIGPCNTPKPSSWNSIELSKCRSWQGLETMATTEAMRLFVKILEEDDPSWYSRASNIASEPLLDMQMNHNSKIEPVIENGTSFPETKTISTENGIQAETQDKDVVSEDLGSRRRQRTSINSYSNGKKLFMTLQALNLYLSMKTGLATVI